MQADDMRCGHEMRLEGMDMDTKISAIVTVAISAMHLTHNPPT